MAASALSESEKAKYIVYDDDPCLGQKAPSLESLEYINGDKVTPGNGKVTVVTFFSKLNKSDFSTLTVLSELSEQDKFKDATQFLAISRDGEKRDVERFLEKFQDKFMAELQAPNGDAGVTVKAHFPLGFDAESKVNKEFKATAKKAVVGVGFTFIIDQEGVIRWYEHFVRGVNPMGQFETQLEHIVNKTDLASNGKMPEIEEEEEEELAGGADIDIDPFGGAGDGY